MTLEAILSKDPASVLLAQRDPMLAAIRHIVKSVRLVTTALEDYVLNVILEPSLLLVLGIVLHAVVDTSVMVIKE